MGKKDKSEIEEKKVKIKKEKVRKEKKVKPAKDKPAKVKVKKVKPIKVVKVKKEKTKSVKVRQEKVRREAGYSASVPGWYKLDNAAKIYPATMRRDWNSVARISVTLDKDIKVEKLRAAVADLRPRFPSFFVVLRKGFFWHYLEPADSLDIVSEECEYPCRAFPVGTGNKPLFRILYYKNRISMEFFHSITDGFGAVAFIKSLVYRYLELCGFAMSDPKGEVLKHCDDPLTPEFEDGFMKYYQKVKAKRPKEPIAYQHRKPRSNDYKYFRVITGSFLVDELRKITKEKGVTITQYLTALLILSIAKDITGTPVRTRRPVRISVPINLRKLFPSTTLRNFSLFVNAGLQISKDITIDDILASVCPQLVDGFEKENIRDAFCHNVKPEKNVVVKVVPLFIKNFIVRMVSKSVGESRFTASFSNMGVVDMPECMRGYVKDIGMVIGPSPNNGINLVGSSYGDRMTMTFSSCFPDTAVQKYFFYYLSELGVNVEVETNV